jgi:hypothetical protein
VVQTNIVAVVRPRKGAEASPDLQHGEFCTEPGTSGNAAFR